MFLQTEFRSTKGDVPLSSDVLLLLYLNISTWYYLCVFGVQTSKCPLEFNKEIRSLDVFFLFFCFCVDYWISVHVMDWFSCFLILSLLKTNSWVVWLYTNTILSKISMSNNCTFVFSVTPLAFNETIYSVGNFCWNRIFFLQSLFSSLFSNLSSACSSCVRFVASLLYIHCRCQFCLVWSLSFFGCQKTLNWCW